MSLKRYKMLSTVQNVLQLMFQKTIYQNDLILFAFSLWSTVMSLSGYWMRPI